MDARIDIEAVKVADLGEGERALWRALRAAHPHLGSPYFDLRYVEAAGRVAPEAGWRSSGAADGSSASSRSSDAAAPCGRWARR